MIWPNIHAWLMKSRAAAVTRRWNQRHKHHQVNIEWAEEAAIAWAMAEVYGATPAGLEYQRHMLEFTEKLPIELVEAIFGGKDIPDELD